MPAKAVILAEGDRPTQMLRMVSGQATRRRTLLDGRSQLLSVLLPGDIIGVQSLFGGVLREAIEAVTDVSVQVASYADIHRLASTNTNVAFWLIWQANQENIKIEKWLTVLTHGTAIEKIAYVLLDFHRRIGDAADGRAQLPLTQREIAEHVGLTLPHVCRMLARLREHGAIGLRYGTIEILQPHMLLDSARELRELLEDHVVEA